jgi:hypothetical protein
VGGEIMRPGASGWRLKPKLIGGCHLSAEKEKEKEKGEWGYGFARLQPCWAGVPPGLAQLGPFFVAFSISFSIFLI